MSTAGQAANEGVHAPVGHELGRRLLAQLRSQSPDLRAAALIGADGNQIAATDDADWTAGLERLWAAAEPADTDGDGSGGETVEVHVGTEAGEVFAVRGSRAAIVATSERFVLASLMFCDLRAVLRALDGPRPRGGQGG